MDRRDALKKLGMGGATVVGASMVMSSPAFAFAPPQNISPPSLTFASVPAPSRVRYAFDSGSAECTASATSGPNQTSSFTGAFSGSAGSRVVVFSTGVPGTITLAPSGSGPAADSAVFRFVKESTADGSEVPYVAGDSISYTLTTTWTCTYDNTPPTASGDGVTNGTISFDGTSWTP